MGVSEKQRKASLKEGGKKGQDVIGMSDMGGVKFFSVVIDGAEGSWELMDASLEGMNKVVDAEADDRKGGAGPIGKFLMHANNDRLLLLCHVPKTLSDAIDQKMWFETVCESVGATAVGSAYEVCVGEEGEGVVVKAEMAVDAEGGKFPLKERDVASAKSYEFLVSKGLVRQDESDDDMNYAENAGIEW